MARMPRKPRLHIDGGYYHVILRGNHRNPIFFTSADRELFAALVADNIERFGLRVHAFCWMSNHVHLLMQVGSVPLARAMMRIAGSFARHMQKHQHTSGHFFERRYRAILVDADEYMLELVRYIHLNPVRAGMVKDPAAYSWSGHRSYLGTHSIPWLTTDFVLSMFASEMRSAREAYGRFISAGVDGQFDKELVMGNANDSRVLGSDRFVENLNHCLPKRCLLSIDQIASRLCTAHDIDAAQLSSASRARSLSLIRALVVHHALHLRVASLSDLARHFNRSASALSQSLDHNRLLRPELFSTTLGRSSE
jgi:putative transposase